MLFNLRKAITSSRKYDIPDASKLVSMNSMFAHTSQEQASFNSSIEKWDISNVTTLNHAFFGATVFNQPLNHWNTAKVKSMASMFEDAQAFDQPIGEWNTENVTDMSLMFKNAQLFNQDISNWNTSNVSQMNSMFSGAASFNQDLSNWVFPLPGNCSGLTFIFNDAGISEATYCKLFNKTPDNCWKNIKHLAGVDENWSYE